MRRLQHLVIIYNPNSTGDSPAMAKKFAHDAKAMFPDLEVQKAKTRYAGHAEELAYEAACRHQEVLIVSVSGDGGYNEVINGALRAQDEGKGKPVCAVLPGGNANDHHSFLNQRPLLEAIAKAKVTKLDVLSISDGKSQRYAHSYIGFGLTPRVAAELNKRSLNRLREGWISYKTFWRFRPFRIRRHEHVLHLDSLVCSNIGRMAKYLTLDEKADPQDGKFEVIIWEHGNKMRLSWQLMQAALKSSGASERVTHWDFKTIKPLRAQLDGELLRLHPNSQVRITLQPKKLATLL